MTTDHVSVADHEEDRGRNERSKKMEKPRLTILPVVSLVDLDNPKLTCTIAERLAGKVDDELLLFTTRMREGFLAASI